MRAARRRSRARVAQPLSEAAGVGLLQPLLRDAGGDSLRGPRIPWRGVSPPKVHQEQGEFFRVITITSSETVRDIHTKGLGMVTTSIGIDEQSACLLRKNDVGVLSWIRRRDIGLVLMLSIHATIGDWIFREFYG